MTADEIRHYRNGYAIGQVMARIERRGKQINRSMRETEQQATRQPHDLRAHAWGVATAMANRPSLF